MRNQHMVDRYKKGDKVSEICKAEGVSHTTLYNILHAAGVECRRYDHSHRAMSSEICKDYVDGNSVIEIATRLKKSPITISEVLRSNGVDVKKGQRRNLKRLQTMIDLYRSGLSTPAVARIMKTSSGAVWRDLSKLGITRPRKNITEATKKRILELKQTGHSSKEIARDCGVSEGTVYNVLTGYTTRRL
jgi:DNA invertase Pin-like site-specific DNA recombinase